MVTVKNCMKCGIQKNNKKYRLKAFEFEITGSVLARNLKDAEMKLDNSRFNKDVELEDIDFVVDKKIKIKQII